MCVDFPLPPRARRRAPKSWLKTAIKKRRPPAAASRGPSLSSRATPAWVCANFVPFFHPFYFDPLASTRVRPNAAAAFALAPRFCEAKSWITFLLFLCISNPARGSAVESQRHLSTPESTVIKLLLCPALKTPSLFPLIEAPCFMCDSETLVFVALPQNPSHVALARRFEVSESASGRGGSGGGGDKTGACSEF